MMSSSSKSFQSNILESFTCGGSSTGGSLSLESVDEFASEKLTALAGYQFVRKLECPNTWEYKAEKQVHNRLKSQAHFQLFLSDFFSFFATKRNAPELH